MNDTVCHENVIAALRLALIGTSEAETFAKVAEVILNEAPETLDSIGGVKLLIVLQQSNRLRFALDVND